jgi:integrase
MATGIEERHARSCRTTKGGRCDCDPSYRASVWDGDKQKRYRYKADNLTEAQQWRSDALKALRRGRKVQVRSQTTFREAAQEWQRLAEAHVIRTAKGDEFKPAALRTYAQHLRVRVLDRYGDEQLEDLTRTDWQELVDELLAEGVAPATVASTISAIAAIYRFEVSRGRLKDNPTRGLDLPSPDNRGERFASPDEAAALLAALPDTDRPIWATAFYTGMRVGELHALAAEDVRLAEGVIRVHWGWDRVEGRQPTKSQTAGMCLSRPPCGSCSLPSCSEPDAGTAN